MRAITFILFSTIIASLVSAQEQYWADTTNSWEDIQWEKILETTIQADENSPAADEAAQLEDDPLNLNTASAEELHRIPAMSNLLAARIIDRRKHKRFTSLDELLEVEGVSPELLSFIRRYVRIGRMKNGPTISASFLSRTSTEIEERQGFINGAYPGSPVKVLNRFHLSIGKKRSPLSSLVSELEVGMLTKKDPGERNVTNFSTYFAGFSIPSLAAHFIIGDYQMEAAEGLIFWRSSAFGKGSDVIAPARKNGGGIHPYLSSDENSFFHGISASIGLDKVQLQVLYSSKTLNATIDSLGSLSSLYKSGLFRTESEQRKRNASRETLTGCRAVTYLLDGLKIGGSFYRTRFANPIMLIGKNGERASELWVRGMDVSFTRSNVDVFSECAFDRANERAVIAGLTYEPAAELALTITARDYPSAFQSVHGNAFGESSGQVQNENGVYIGIRAQPISWLSLSTYYDQFEHPQPTYLLPAPSHGNDFLALAECSVTEQFEISFRFKRKDLPSAMNENDLYGRILKGTISRVQQNYRLTTAFISSPSLRLVSRVEWVNINYGGMQSVEQGVLISQTMKWNIFHPLTIQARLSVFGTDSYDSSIYEFEDEVPGAYSNPALFGRGMRWYFILRYQLFSKMDIAAKYAQTVKEGIKSIGTGLDEISGDSQSVVSMQIEVRF
ncbi:MAG: helix-hairpin-helix domain-containing protein [Ignavibacteriales bacterium]|nr:helix-hairpin-helix domain-containing protein [Ignavibacteriales bacterium]